MFKVITELKKKSYIIYLDMAFTPDLLQNSKLQQFLDVFVQSESNFLSFVLEIY